MSLTPKKYIESIIADQLEAINLKNQNLDKNLLLKLRPKVAIDDKVTSGTVQKEGDAVVASIFGYVMGFMIYIVLLIYGTMVMRGVMEEKSSRIIEVNDGQNNRNWPGGINSIYNLGIFNSYFKYNCRNHFCTTNDVNATIGWHR